MRRLSEFYFRFKGQRIASFDHPGDPEVLSRPWHCTINLSGGRISDSVPLPSCTFEVRAAHSICQSRYTETKLLPWHQCDNVPSCTIETRTVHAYCTIAYC